MHCMRSAALGRPDSVVVEQLLAALRSSSRDSKIDRVVVSGGEPTLVPNLAAVLSGISEIGLQMSLCTNGTTGTPELAKTLDVAGLKKITIGIEALGDAYDYFRKSPGGFGRVLAGVRAYVQQRMEVTINITLHDGILGQGAEFGRSFTNLGIAKISVTTPIRQGRLRTSGISFRQGTLVDAMSFANDLTQSLGVATVLRIPQCGTSTCPSGRSVFSIDASGSLADCPDIKAIPMCHIEQATRDAELANG